MKLGEVDKMKGIVMVAMMVEEAEASDRRHQLQQHEH